MSAVPLTNPEQHGDALTGKLKRTELQHSASSIPGREIVQVLTEATSGTESGWHIHSGDEVSHPRRHGADNDPGKTHPHPARRTTHWTPAREDGRMLSAYIVETGAN